MVSELVASYRPGSHDPPWSWDDEAIDLLGHPCPTLAAAAAGVEVARCTDGGHPAGCYQRALERHLAEVGEVIQPVCLGPDGRVWDGHHRIVGALRLGIAVVPVEGRPPTTIDHRVYGKALRRGELGPGTDRVLHPELHGRVELHTVPSRVPRWVQSPNGRLFHLIRYAEVVWTFAGERRGRPRLSITTWCGQQAGRGYATGRDPRLTDRFPDGPKCRRCTAGGQVPT